MTLLARFISCAAALALYDGCYGQCDAACISDVNLTITANSRSFSTGRYTIAANVDGVMGTTECIVEPSGNSSCSGTSDAGVQVRSASVLLVGIHGAPKHVEVTVSFEGELVATASFDPQYVKKEPVCGRTCYGATHTVAAK